jgi:DNA helicase-4
MQPLQQPRSAGLNTFQRVKKLIRETIFPKKTARFRSLQEDYSDFSQQNLSNWRKYPKYLLTEEQVQLRDQLIKLKKRTRSYGFLFSDLVKPLKQRFKADLAHIKTYNETYISHEIHEHKAFFNGVESKAKIGLNAEQIKAILVNERNNLLVAGPGSGKTRVITERVAFYHFKKGIPQDRILVLAFNKSAAAEVRTRLKNTYEIKDVEIRTFHSLGLRIISHIKKRNGQEISPESNAKRKIRKIIDNFLLASPQYHLDYLNFFNHYLLKINFSKYHSTNKKLLEFKATLKYNALDNTQVKSIAERDIANFFIRHGIKYEYEWLVLWCDKDTDPEFADNPRQYHPDFYLSDYDIYLEHWAIAEDGTPPEWFNDDANQYHKNRLWKREQFRKYNKVLWETDYQDWTNGILKAKLENYCQINNIQYEKVSQEELLENIGKNSDDKGVLGNSIISYIEAAKNCGYSASQFQAKVFKNIFSLNAFDASFFSLVVPIFTQYELDLQKNNKIDFNDMINKTVELLQNPSKFQSQLQSIFSYDLIFVDEYQDISPQRYNLLDFVRKLNPYSRLFCVGDDWQAIYGFAGATNIYLTQYKKFFNHVELNFLQRNYRNTSSILNYGEKIVKTTGDFIDKKFNPFNQLKTNSIFLTRIQSDSKELYQTDEKEKVLELLSKLIDEEKIPPNEIMVLSRFNFCYLALKKSCEETTNFNVQLRKAGLIVKEGLQFYSTHKCKGLEADIVILLDINQGKYGFPSEIESGINYKFINEKLVDRKDEEARLFFVALTRARKRVYLFCREDYESEFIPSKPTNSDMYEIYLQQNYWDAKIVKSTELELLLQVQVQFNECLEIWIPKTFVISNYKINSTQLQKIQVNNKWINLKLRISNPKLLSLEELEQPAEEIPIISPFQRCLDEGFWNARILRTTERALLLMIIIDSEKYETEWVPKSVITKQYSLIPKKLQRFYIKKFWLRKSISENSSKSQLYSRKSSTKKQPSKDIVLSQSEEKIFQVLKQWRSELTKMKKLPAYVIFHDKTLKLIAQADIRAKSDLLKIYGVGKKKLDSYGDDLIKILRTN